MPGPNHAIKVDGLKVPDTRGTHGKKREQRMARLVNRVFELREQGLSKKNIAKEVHVTEPTLDKILHDPDNVRRRLTLYNEQLRAATPKALKVVHEVLDSTAPQMLSERSRMAQWVLESTKTVGKESPVNVFIRGGDTNINVSNDTLEAARAVAAQMRAAVQPQLTTGEVVDAIDVTDLTEENSDVAMVQEAGEVPGTGTQNNG